MSQSTMSYGQALNEARQMIIQQQYRIKADADKIKSQQQQIVDQSAVLVESEAGNRRTILPRSKSAFGRAAGRPSADHRDHHRQGTGRGRDRPPRPAPRPRCRPARPRWSRRIAEHTAAIAALTTERDVLAAQLPTPEDEEMLASMSWISPRQTSRERAEAEGPVSHAAPTIRLAEVFSDGPAQGAPGDPAPRTGRKAVTG